MRAALAIALLPLACTSAAKLEPDEIVFPPTHVGTPVAVALPTLSGGAPLAHPLWHIERPFDVDAAPLAPGGRLRFLALEAGTFRATLQAQHEGRWLTASVRAEAVACTSTADCDDAVDCTADSCEGGRCEHRPDNGRCRAEEACSPGVCAPEQGGCRIFSRPDETPCEATVFPGCQVPSTCERGVCTIPQLDDSQCAGAEPVPLAPVWTYAALPAPRSQRVRAVLRTATSDDALRSAFLECDVPEDPAHDVPSDCALVSLDADGRTRFRVELGHKPVWAPGPGTVLARFADQVVVGLDLTPGTEQHPDLPAQALAAYRWEDGSFAWAIRSRPETERTAFALHGPLLRLSDTEILVHQLVLHLPRGGDDVRLRVDATSGAIVGRKSTKTLPFVAASGAGALFLQTDEYGANYVEAYDEALVKRWSHRLPFPEADREFQAMDGDTVIIASGQALNARDGTLRREFRRLHDRVRLSRGRAWSVSDAPSQLGCAVRVTTARVDSAQDEESCTLLSQWKNPPVLTDRGTLLVLTGGRSIPSQLWEVAPGRRVLQAATLEGTLGDPDSSGHDDIAGLAAGRVLVLHNGSLAAYDLPQSVDLAPSGWVAEGGSFARDGAPR